MTMTRETVEKLMSDATPGPWYIQHETDSPELSIVDDRGFFVATAHTGVTDPGLSGWQTEPNAHLIISVHDIAAALLAAWDERDVLRAALDTDDKMISEITEDVVRWKRRAEAAEANVARLESHIEATAKDIHKLLIAAEAEIAELKLDATARDVRIFELSEELDDAEAKVARLVEAMERIKSSAMWVRGEQAYREFPKYVLNAVRDALSDIKGDKP